MRKPFTSWHVGDTEYKLKLTTATVCKLEENLGVNIIKIFKFNDDMPIPPLKTMLFIIHGAIQKYHHGLKFEDVQNIFDDYLDCGKDQTSLLTDVLIPLMQDSGFIPTKETAKKAKKKEKTTLSVVKE